MKTEEGKGVRRIAIRMIKLSMFNFSQMPFRMMEGTEVAEALLPTSGW